MTIHLFNATLHDARHALLSLPICAVIVDPPYRDAVHSKAMSNGTAGAGPHAREMGFAPLTDQLVADIAQLCAHAKRWGAVFCDVESSHRWRAGVEGAGAEYVRTLPWIRWSQPQLSGDRPPSGCELIVLFHPPGRKHWSGPGSLTAVDHRSLRGKDKFPAEKPLDLMLSLVSWFSDAGELVCDPCAGSGTTGLACRLLGREAVLLEANPATCEIARAKIYGELTARDRERCERWVEYQEAWLAGGAPDTAAGKERYARARADTDRITATL